MGEYLTMVNMVPMKINCKFLIKYAIIIEKGTINFSFSIKFIIKIVDCFIVIILVVYENLTNKYFCYDLFFKSDKIN